MAKYQRKPKVVDAWQWTGLSLEDAEKFFNQVGITPGSIEIRQRKGEEELEAEIYFDIGGEAFYLERGDWMILEGSKYYKCMGRFFKYEPVAEYEGES